VFAFAISAYFRPHRFEFHAGFGIPGLDNLEEFLGVQPVGVFEESWWSWGEIRVF
jgi:hypothetical protein